MFQIKRQCEAKPKERGNRKGAFFFPSLLRHFFWLSVSPHSSSPLLPAIQYRPRRRKDIDAMANDASLPAVTRDLAKKKRVNRSAKLKQCKLDARREQWLSQVKNKSSAASEGAGALPASSQSHLPPVAQPQAPLSLPRSGCKGLGNACGQDDSGLQDEGEEFPAGPENGTRFAGTGINCGSSFGSSSRSISDAEEEEERGVEKGGLDDWEAVADSLTDTNDHGNWHAVHDARTRTNVVESTGLLGAVNETCCAGSVKAVSGRTVHRAWTPDDESRPLSLPNLTKHLSFPASIERNCLTALTTGWARHGIISTPSSCPICYEDLDLTDSSFIPCDCRFRLCLFCYNRILEADERCPGCRKQYTPLVGSEVSVKGGTLHFAFCLSRSYTMGPRS